MGVIDSLNETSNKAVDVGEQYYRKTQEYYTLKVFQQISMTTGMLFKIAIIGGMGFLCLIFFSIAGIIFLGNLLESMVQSCLIAGLVFFVFLILIYIFRRKIDDVIVKKLSVKFFKQ